jgi:hypothetical protein
MPSCAGVTSFTGELAASEVPPHVDDLSYQGATTTAPLIRGSAPLTYSYLPAEGNTRR